MIKNKYIIIFGTMLLIYSIFVHAELINKKRCVEILEETITTSNELKEKLSSKIRYSNSMTGTKLNNCFVSSVSTDLCLSALLKDTINVVFRFSNTTCSDCLEQQVEIMHLISNSYDCILLSSLENKRLLNFFSEQLGHTIYNLQMGQTLFENDDENRPLLAIVNEDMKITTLHYCDDIFEKFYQMLIPEYILRQEQYSTNGK